MTADSTPQPATADEPTTDPVQPRRLADVLTPAHLCRLADCMDTLDNIGLAYAELASSNPVPVNREMQADLRKWAVQLADGELV